MAKNANGQRTDNRTTDEELICLSQHGDTEAMDYLMNKYKGLVRSVANHYYLMGADKEDVVQEGMIGLYKAIRDFKPDKNASFRTFAMRCIFGEIATAIRYAQSNRQRPLNESLLIGEMLLENHPDLPKGRLEDVQPNPEQLILENEYLQGIYKELKKNLSKREWEVLTLFLQGKLRREISEELDVEIKSADNTLWRARQKCAQILEEKSRTKG